MFHAVISSINILEDEGKIFKAGCCNYEYKYSGKCAILALDFRMLNAWLTGVFFTHQNN